MHAHNVNMYVPSSLIACVQDYIDALAWADATGGVPGLIKRSQANLSVIESFVAKHDWIDFLAKEPATRSNTSVCLTLDLEAAQVCGVQYSCHLCSGMRNASC